MRRGTTNSSHAFRYYDPQEGRILIDGQDVTGASAFPSGSNSFTSRTSGRTRWITSATFFAWRRNWSSTPGFARCVVSSPAVGRLSEALNVAKRTSASGGVASPR